MMYVGNERNGFRIRRWVAAVLAAALLFSSVPLTALAAKAPADGTLDFPSLAIGPGNTVTASNIAALNDDNPSTHAGDFRPEVGRSFTLDFGADYGVKATEIKMQARTGFPARLYNGRVEGSMDGSIWTEITASKAVSSTEMQTLPVKAEFQTIPYRYLKIAGEGQGNIFNIGELRIGGTSVKLENLISTVSISSNHAGDSSKAVANDTITLQFTSAVPLSNVKVTANGASYSAQSEDQIHWTASYAVSPYTFASTAAFAISYTDANGNYGKPVASTTDGSAVFIEEPSDYIDVLSAAEAFGIPAKDNNGQLFVTYSSSNATNGAAFAARILDRNVSTYADWVGPHNNGNDSYLVIDMGDGNAKALNRVYMIARSDQASRLTGAHIQGSHDGLAWSTISSSAAGSKEWQTLSVTDRTPYRYFKITNNSAWFLNVAEIKFYGKQPQPGVLDSDLLIEKIAAAEAIIEQGSGSYTVATWRTLELALTEGKAAIADLDSGNEAGLIQNDLDLLTAALVSAMDGLQKDVQVISVTSEEGFIHPGISVTKEVLENLKKQINDKQEPWYSYYKAMLETDYAKAAFAMNNSIDGITVRTDAYNGQNVKDMASRDGQRAYTQALLYYLTGNDTYRSNALRILRVWMQMDPSKYQYFTDSHIHTGIPLYFMVMAAELLRYTSASDELKWTQEDTEKFTKNIIDPTVKTFLDFNDKFMNQHNYPLYGTIASYIFKNDAASYAKAVEWLTINDSAPDKYMTGSIYWLFREMTQNDETGEPVEPHMQHIEMGRDLAHGEGDVTNFINLARLVDAQGSKVDPVNGTLSDTGVSIYEFLDDRILRGADYYARFSEGYDITWTPAKATAESEWAREKLYTIPSDEYKGRMHYLGTGGWDLYYVYRYKLGYTEEQLEALAPYYVKAFKSRVAPNHYFSGSGSSVDVAKTETGAEWWLFVPKEVADEPTDSISRTVRSNTVHAQRYLLQLDEAYSIIDGSNQIKESTDLISTRTEGDVEYIRAVASDNDTLFAAYRLMFINRNDTANVALRIRTDGQAKLELKKDKDSVPFHTLNLPDTQGQWKFVTFDMGQQTVSYGQFSALTFMAYFNVLGNGTTVDIDYMDIKADNTLTPPKFRNLAGKDMNLSLVAGSTVHYDFSAVDKNNADVVAYQLQGDSLPGATLNSATGAFVWTPTAQQAGTYRVLATASDGASVTTATVNIHVSTDRLAAIANVVAGYDEAIAYESASLEAYEEIYANTIGTINTASDGDFYERLNELAQAVVGLRLLNPTLGDGSLDFTASAVKTSLQTGFDAYLIDGNPVTFGGDLTAKYFTMDFGPNFRISPAAFALQPRNIWPERMAGAIVYGSKDGESWVQLTDEAAYSNQLQTLNVKPERAAETYRYLKVSTLESSDYYAQKNTILSVGEFRVFGSRTEIATRIAEVAISTNANPLIQHLGNNDNMQVPVKKAVAGDTITLNIKAKQPLTELSASIAGMSAEVTKLDDLHYTAAVVLSASAAAQNASRYAKFEINYKYLDAKNNQHETAGNPVVYTSDGSMVLVSDASKRIDRMLDKAVLTFNRPTDIGSDIGPRLFDRNTSTFVDIRNSAGSGDGVYYLFDFGNGAVSLSGIEVVARMTTNLAGRMIGIYAEGSNDGVNFKRLTAPTQNIWDWQGLPVSDSTYYRYIRIMNRSLWFGNLSELEFYGTHVADRSTLLLPPTVQSAVPGDGKVALSWSSVAGATGYKIYASTASGSYADPALTLEGDATNVDVTGLANGTMYYFAVAAITAGGSSELSQEISAVPAAASINKAALTGPEEAYVGQTIDLTIGVETLTDSFTTLDVILNYDPQKFGFNTVLKDGNATLAEGAWTVKREGTLQVIGTAVKPEQGQIRILMASTGAPVTGAGELLALHGHVLDEAVPGSLVVSLSDFEISLNGEVLAVDASEAIGKIEVKLADKATLAAKLTSAQQLYDETVQGNQPGQYPAAAREALQVAIAAGTAVLSDTAATQSEVNAAAAALESAVTAYKGAVVPSVPDVPVDKAGLQAALAEAKAKLERSKAGSKIGQYPQQAMDALAQAIAAAEAVRGHSSASQSQVDAAAQTLKQAVQTFAGKIVTLVAGTGKVSIKDLSFIAKYYGATQADANWNEIEKADLFGQGEINIVVLAAVARMILDEWLME